MGKEKTSKKEEVWWYFYVDGKNVGKMKDGARCEKERRRLSGLHGVEFKKTVMNQTSQGE